MLSVRPGGVRLGRAVAACWRLECAYVCVGRARQAARAARSLVEGSARWLVWEPRCHLPLGRHLRLIEPPMLFNNHLLHSQCLLLPAQSGATERGSATFTEDDRRHPATFAAEKVAP